MQVIKERGKGDSKMMMIIANVFGSKESLSIKTEVHTHAPGIKAHTYHTLLKLTSIQDKNENLYVNDKKNRE